MHASSINLQKSPTYLSMGCGASQLVGGGRPPRPVFLHQVHRPPPKLIMHDSDEDSQKYRTPLSEENGVFGRIYNEEKHGNISKLEIEAGLQKNIRDGSRDESEFEDALTHPYEDEDEDEDENKMRMIGHEHDDGAFPGSPTFRYFCNDGDGNDNSNGDDHGKTYVICADDDDDDDTASPKENCNDEKMKKVKRGRKIKSFKKVVPKGGQAAVKKLLNLKLRCTQSSSTHHHHQTHLLLGKA